MPVIAIKRRMSIEGSRLVLRVSMFVRAFVPFLNYGKAYIPKTLDRYIMKYVIFGV